MLPLSDSLRDHAHDRSCCSAVWAASPDGMASSSRGPDASEIKVPEAGSSKYETKGVDIFMPERVAKKLEEAKSFAKFIGMPGLPDSSTCTQVQGRLGGESQTRVRQAPAQVPGNLVRPEDWPGNDRPWRSRSLSANSTTSTLACLATPAGREGI